MNFKNNVVDFPSPLSQKKKKYIMIRDEVERILAQYAQDQGDLWAVALASGRFSSMTLGKIEGSDKAIELSEKLIEVSPFNRGKVFVQKRLFTSKKTKI